MDSTDSDTILKTLASIADPHVSKAVLQGLIDGSISRTKVLEEFYPEFCSSALVHAILALATRLINERSDDAGLHQSGWPRSRCFMNKAKTILQDTKAPSTLPDIQALGIFSLYYLRCGQETEAQAYAESFATSISDLFQRSPMYEGEDDYAESLRTSYCGAVSLMR
ncbi:hypothetical protein NEMBOFW57_009518 [Staphylotrichum longicolle]|uniref:Uncharacterized protein n=1 Tax=Staphylotrichum longicolle TaxID=669026 RepID=A0AAD4ET75_9PEZI|nr:hypothetical protein NEMBOFW57_009518 [Staphylotrichum longicolle]